MTITMPMFSVRVPEDLASRFDAAASAAGGRSARLRQLIQSAAGPDGAGGSERRLAAPTRLMVRLGPAEAAHVVAHADAMSLRPATWVAALVRRHTLMQPTLPRSEEVAILAIQGEVHRIGINVNQIARALNTAVLEGRVLELELSDIRALQLELRAHIQALKASFEGNLAYWDAR